MKIEQLPGSLIKMWNTHKKGEENICTGSQSCWHGSSSLPGASSGGGNRKINDLLENNRLISYWQRRRREPVAPLSSARKPSLSHPFIFSCSPGVLIRDAQAAEPTNRTRG